MKKFFLMAIIAGFTYFGTTAQTAPGNSAYGHSHKKAKKVKKHHYVTKTTAAQRKAINEQHKTSVRTIQRNDALTDQQQKDQIKQANVIHKDQMKSANVYRKARKK